MPARVRHSLQMILDLRHTSRVCKLYVYVPQVGRMGNQLACLLCFWRLHAWSVMGGLWHRE